MGKTNETFTIDVSQLKNYTEKEIKETLNKHTKRELLENLLVWKGQARHFERLLDEERMQLKK